MTLFDSRDPRPLPPGLGHLAPSPGGPVGTSFRAANLAAKSEARRKREILELLAAAGDRGMTCHEMAEAMSRELVVGSREAMPVTPNQISGRLGGAGGLMADGVIERTGQRRPTPTGALADVWRITEEGTKALRQ